MNNFELISLDNVNVYEFYQICNILYGSKHTVRKIIYCPYNKYRSLKTYRLTPNQLISLSESKSKLNFRHYDCKYLKDIPIVDIEDIIPNIIAI